MLLLFMQMSMNVLLVHITAVTMQHAQTQMSVIRALVTLGMMEMDLTVPVREMAECHSYTN